MLHTSYDTHFGASWCTLLSYSPAFEISRLFIDMPLNMCLQKFTQCKTSWHSVMVQVFELASIHEADAMMHYPVLEMAMRNKVSSICWNSYVKSCLLAADYEGHLQLCDVAANQVTSQFEEHSKRVWSVDFSQVGPSLYLAELYLKA